MNAPRLFELALAAAPGVALSYSDDDLCRAIGQTRENALQPRDRLFFEEKCTCYPDYGCMARGSPKDIATRSAVEKDRAAKQKAAEEGRAARAERAKKAAKAKREKTAKERAAYAACIKGGDPICGDEGQRLKDACAAVGLSGDGCWSLDE